MDITYKQFLDLVRNASGPFSYQFAGMKMVCDPIVYVARNWKNGLPNA
jgi:hypothetical protein